MRVISQTRLKEFWSEYDEAEQPLKAWYTHVSNRKVEWQNWGDVRSVFGTASPVGNCVVFNIGGNKFRLVTRVLYPSQTVYILKVMTHEQYDDEKWIEECGCRQAPPTKQPKSGLSPAKRKGRR